MLLLQSRLDTLCWGVHQFILATPGIQTGKAHMASSTTHRILSYTECRKYNQDFFVFCIILSQFFMLSKPISALHIPKIFPLLDCVAEHSKLSLLITFLLEINVSACCFSLF